MNGARDFPRAGGKNKSPGKQYGARTARQTLWAQGSGFECAPRTMATEPGTVTFETGYQRYVNRPQNVFAEVVEASERHERRRAVAGSARLPVGSSTKSFTSYLSYETSRCAALED